MDNVGKMLLVYDPATGEGIYTFEWPWNDTHIDRIEAQGHYWVYSDPAIVNRVYVDLSGEEPVAHLKETGPWSVNDLAHSASGVDYFEITDLPEDAQVVVGEETYIIDDGEFSFSSDIPGVFKFLVTKWPYLPSIYEVTFS